VVRIVVVDHAVVGCHQDLWLPTLRATYRNSWRRFFRDGNKRANRRWNETRGSVRR
jgi:hypothetical protein